MLARRALDHTRFRLATIAIVGGTVRAIVNARPDAPIRLQFALHAFIHLLYERFRKIAAGHAGLVGHDNHGQARFVQAADGWPRKRKHTKSVGMIQVTDFLGNGAVAIEENGGFARGMSSDRSHLREPGRAARLRPFPASRRSCSDGPWGNGAGNRGCSRAFAGRCVARRRYRRGAFGIGGTEDRDYRQADGCGDVHCAGIVSEEQMALREKRGQFGDGGFSCEVDGRMAQFSWRSRRKRRLRLVVPKRITSASACRKDGV